MKKLLLFEWNKIFSRRIAQIGILLVLLLNGIFLFSEIQSFYAYDHLTGKSASGLEAVKLEQEIAARYSGILDNEKVQHMLQDFKPSYEDLEKWMGISVANVYMNDMQSAVHNNFADKNGEWNGKTVKDVFGDNEIQVGFISGWLKLNRLLIKGYLSAAILVIILVTPVFAGEYNGPDSLILSTRYGRTKCRTAKILAALSTALLIPLCVTVFYGIAAFCMYGTIGLDNSVLFTGNEYLYKGYPNITCGTMLFYQFLLALSAIVMITGITLLVSALCRNQMTALACGAALLLLPLLLPVTENNPLYPVFVLSPIYQIQFYSIMAANPILAAPVSIITAGLGGFVSGTLFGKHQVS